MQGLSDRRGSRRHGARRQCEKGRYNGTEGIITCHDHDYNPDAFANFAEYTVAQEQYQPEQNMVCLDCPACVDCTRTNSPPRIRAGFGVAPSDEAHDLWANGTNATGNRQLARRTVVRCRSQSSSEDVLKDERVLESLDQGVSPEAYLDPSGKPDAEVQCLGTVKGTPTCTKGHTGTLCGSCQEGYGRAKEDQCVLCSEATDPVLILQTVLIAAGVALVVSLAMIGISFCVGDVYGEDLGARGRGDATTIMEINHDEVEFEFTNPVAANQEDRTADEERTVGAASTMAIQRLFKRVDENQSGCLERDEVRQLARMLGVTLRRTELDAAMGQMDDNGDGTIDPEEFEQWFRGREPDGLFPSMKVSAATIFETSERLLLAGASMMLQPVIIFVSVLLPHCQRRQINRDLKYDRPPGFLLADRWADGGTCLAAASHLLSAAIV